MPDPSTVEALRREAYVEIGRMAVMAEEYAQKMFDATDDRDLMALAVRLQQLRFCVMASIKTFNLILRKLDDQNISKAGRSSPAGRQDQRTGDVVA